MTTTNIAFDERAFVCIHVFEQTRPVLLVLRPEGDWCLLCGQEHPQDVAYFRVACLGHFLEADKTLVEVLDLPRDWDAERASVGAPWLQRPSTEDG